MEAARNSAALLRLTLEHPEPLLGKGEARAPRVLYGGLPIISPKTLDFNKTPFWQDPFQQFKDFPEIVVGEIIVKSPYRCWRCSWTPASPRPPGRTPRPASGGAV